MKALIGILLITSAWCSELTDYIEGIITECEKQQNWLQGSEDIYLWHYLEGAKRACEEILVKIDSVNEEK